MFQKSLNKILTPLKKDPKNFFRRPAAGDSTKTIK